MLTCGELYKPERTGKQKLARTTLITLGAILYVVTTCNSDSYTSNDQYDTPNEQFQERSQSDLEKSLVNPHVITIQ